jgi:hypothetical protein
MTQSTFATAAAFTIALATVALATTSFAQSDDQSPTTSATIEMQLIDQTFDLEPGGNIVLTYRLVGDLAVVAELTPPTTTTEPPPTTTTVPPISTAPTDPSAPPQPAPISQPAEAVPPTTEPPPPVSIVARVTNYEPLDDPSDLAGIVGRSSPLTTTDPGAIDAVVIDARALTEVSEDGTAIVALTVPTDSDPSIQDNLKFNDSGIHPILVELLVSDVVVADHATVVERQTGAPDTPPPISLSLLAAIDSPGPNATSVTIDASVEQLADIARTAEQLDAPFTLSIPPSVATAAAASDGGTERATQVADDQLLAFPATAIDVSSATEVGRIDAFVNQLLAGEEQLRAALPRVDVGRDIWLSTEPLSGAAAQELRDLGVQYLAMPASLYSSTVAESPSDELPDRDRLIEISLPNGAVMPMILIDDQLGSAFTPDATTEILTQQTSTEWAIETLALLRLEQFGAPSNEQRDARGHVIATPDLTAPDPRLIAELERIAAKTSTLDFVQASQLVSLTATQRLDTAVGLPARAGPSLTARLERIATTQAGLATAESMLPDNDARPIEWRAALDSLISTAFDDNEVQSVLDGLTDEANAVTSAVVPPKPFTFTLTGREDDIEIRIRNTLAEPLTVILRLTSPRLSFPNGDQLVTLAPDDVTPVTVALVARSNGTSPVTVEIFAPFFGDSLAEPFSLTEPVTLTARVTALTGIAQVVTGAFVLILLTWWFSHWRSRRRAGTNDESAPDSTRSLETSD